MDDNDYHNIYQKNFFRNLCYYLTNLAYNFNNFCFNIQISNLF